MKPGHGFADYLLYVDGQAVGVVEAKKEGETLTTYEIQTAKYSEGLPAGLKAHRRPLPFCYQSTGAETRFTNLLDPDARSRQVFAFHRPETFAKWIEDDTQSPGCMLRAPSHAAADRERPAGRSDSRHPRTGEVAGSSGPRFTPEQIQWLELIRDHVGASLAIELDDFEYVPFAQHGGIGKAYQVFGTDLQPLLEELNEALAA